MNLASLEKTGSQVYRATKWVGEVGIDRREEQTEDIRSVYIHMTPAEWCALCMREGSHYIGGCCGASSYIQDCFNAIFRDNGIMDARVLIELAGACRNHPDGFELFCEEEMSQGAFDENCGAWDRLGIFEKFATVWHGVRDRVKELPGSIELGEDLSKPKDCVVVLQNGLQVLRWQDFFDKEESGQRHGNRAVLFARLMPAARVLVDSLNKMAPAAFEGFAIFDRRLDNVASNGYGACFYRTEAEANEMVELWKKSDADGKAQIADRLSIRKVHVSMEKGIEWS